MKFDGLHPIDSAHWQWGEDNVIKNFANEKLCVSATSEGNGQAIIMANCNQASVLREVVPVKHLRVVVPVKNNYFRHQVNKNGIHFSVVAIMLSKNKEQN